MIMMCILITCIDLFLHVANGWMESFCDYYKKDFIFSTREECSEMRKKNHPSLVQWVQERHMDIKNMMTALPDTERSILFMDILTWMTCTEPKVAFDILVRF